MRTESSVLCVERTRATLNERDIRLGEGLREPEQRRAFCNVPVATTAKNVRLRDATIDPPLAAVYHGGVPISDTLYCVTEQEHAASRQQFSEPGRVLQEPRHFMGYNRVAGNYFHLLLQVLPAIGSYAADPEFASSALLLPPPEAFPRPIWAALDRALELMGIRTSVVRLSAAPTHIQDLTYSNLLFSTVIGPSHYALLDSISRRSDHVNEFGSPKAIYICRSDTPARPLRNEEALVMRLAQHAIIPVVLSELSLDEQITLFRDARLIIGAHGAGLANIVFSQTGTALYELLPSHYLNPCMAHIAQSRSLHYWCDVHPSDDKPGSWRHQVAWTVDVDAVERRVLQILQHYQSTP